MKRIYVLLVRTLRRVLGAVGVVGLLDRWAGRSRTGLWVRSLLSIYDLEELLAYDVPWWTFRSSDLVASHLSGRPGARVFEWGSGASTVWLASRAASVVSVEHDAAWAETMRGRLPDNAALHVVEPLADPLGSGIGSAKPGFEGLDFTAYVGAIDATEGDFDLIVVDGRAREACFDRSVDRLAPGGLVVFDNVDRERYRDAIARHGDTVSVTWTRGLTPTLPYPTRTALITRANDRPTI